MTSAGWCSHPVTRIAIYGQTLEIGDVVSEGDLCDADSGWIPTQLAGIPVTEFTRTTYVRPMKVGAP